jgi:hypothetical protein
LARPKKCQGAVKLLLPVADPRVDLSAGQPPALAYGIRCGHIGVAELLLTHAKTVITREALAKATDHESINAMESKPNGVLTKYVAPMGEAVSLGIIVGSGTCY